MIEADITTTDDRRTIHRLVAVIITCLQPHNDPVNFSREEKSAVVCVIAQLVCA